MMLVVLSQAASQSPLGLPVAPAWLVLPLAVVALLVIATHWVMLGKAPMPATRKRIRSACGVLMMLSVPIFAYAFGIATTARPREFVLAWMLASSMLFLILMLAAADLIFTAYELRAERRRMREEMQAATALAKLREQEQAHLANK